LPGDGVGVLGDHLIFHHIAVSREKYHNFTLYFHFLHIQ